MSLTKQKESNRGKSVLLFSGGMDSIMFYHLLKPDVVLYIPSGSNYTDIETSKIKQMVKDGVIDEDKLIILDNTINLSMFERDDFIVPNRNAYLILLASHFGETIYLGSVYGDRSFDKDENFYTLMENLLNYIWQEQHWTEKREFNISSPYKNKTKTEIVKEYIEKNGNIQNILNSYSCYKGEKIPCGVCKPCVRKYVSLINNNISIPDNYYQTNPLKAEWVYEIKQDILNENYRGKEDKEFKKVYFKNEI